MSSRMIEVFPDGHFWFPVMIPEGKKFPGRGRQRILGVTIFLGFLIK